VENAGLKRFYKAVTTQLQDDGWRVLLDGRAIKTAGGNPQLVPTHALAEAMVAEWTAQGEQIDPRGFAMRDLADYAIDVVSGEARSDLIDELAAYAGTDTLCYRVSPDQSLHERQVAVWEPVLTEAERRHDVHFERITEILHQPQPEATLARMKSAVAALDPFPLAALRVLTSLTASLVIALAALEPEADAQRLWEAANLEEDWQGEHWGRDAEAEALRQTRFEAFAMAIRFAALARDGESG